MTPYCLPVCAMTALRICDSLADLLPEPEIHGQETHKSLGGRPFHSKRPCRCFRIGATDVGRTSIMLMYLPL